MGWVSGRLCPQVVPAGAMTSALPRYRTNLDADVLRAIPASSSWGSDPEYYGAQQYVAGQGLP